MRPLKLAAASSFHQRGQRELQGPFFNPLGAYSDNAPVFRWQHVLTANWNTGDWSAILAQRFKTGYTDHGI